MEATIILKYDNAKTASAIAQAVTPDNATAPPGLKVETFIDRCNVITTIKFDGKIGTFLSTIDDLLEGISTAEKTLRLTRLK
ncbi:MAG: KEOPS complex subunit Pcc1 [Candidatus Bathyarchaeota archaeon]|nr:KEOPS complex subunit Pcc1 [Candidatus Bathyarchaeota archaeon]